jgi:uncharacterized protein YbjT (DUF2867 family)
MTQVLITGGTGVLGQSLLARSAAHAYDVRTFSRHRASRLPEGVKWVRADLGTGEGLEEAVAGVDAIIHAASSPRKDTHRIDVEGTRRLVEAARHTGVRHLVFVSIVGVDRVPISYYRHKLEAERVVREGPVPWTILRITQFHDFVDTLLRDLFLRFPVGLLPKDWKYQPVDVDKAAEALWACVAAGPRGQPPGLGGPQVLTFGELAKSWLAARGKRKPILHLPLPGRVAASIRRGSLTVPHLANEGLTWAEWLQARYARQTRQAGADAR